MSDLYFLHSTKELKKLLEKYLPLVILVAQKMGINLKSKHFVCDHLGFQMNSEEEFDSYDKILRSYLIPRKSNIIHSRRCQIFKFPEPIKVKGLKIHGLEIFEPKPGEGDRELRYGLEHISFVVSNYEKFKKKYYSKLPIAKEANYDGSPFLKLKLVNNIEIEFRTNKLIDLE